MGDTRCGREGLEQILVDLLADLNLSLLMPKNDTTSATYTTRAVSLANYGASKQGI